MVVIHDVDTSDTVVVPWDEVKDTVEVERRTGLTAARPESFAVPSTAESSPAEASSVLSSWDLLLGAALVGIADRAVRTTEAYVLERKQFGVPIGSFAGLRALVAEMRAAGRAGTGTPRSRSGRTPGRAKASRHSPAARRSRTASTRSRLTVATAT